MNLALDQARLAAGADEVPVGAVIVSADGEVLAVAGNRTRRDHDPTAHAEILAIRQAALALGQERLEGCSLYVTLEPCHMCAKAIADARLKNLFFGANEPKTGAIVSVDHFLDASHLNHKVNYSSGHLASDSVNLLKSFFRSKRV